MSPTLTDDALVRELAERTDRALPAMALDAVGVLAAGRDWRQRQTVLRSIGSLAAVTLVAVGVAALGPGLRSVPPTGPDDAAADLGIEVEIPEDVDVIDTDLGPALDTGLNQYGLEYSNSEYAIKLVLVPTMFPPESPTIAAVGLLALSPDGSTTSPVTYPLADLAESPDAWWTATDTGDRVTYLMGVAPPGLEDPKGALVVGGPDNGLRFALQMVDVPGVDRPVFLAVVRDVVASTAAWPPIVIEFAGSDGTIVRSPALDGSDGAEPVTGADTLRIETATDVTPVEADDGPAYDLGVQVGDGWSPPDQDLTYALRAGALVDGDSRTPDEPGLWLVTLAPDGSTVTGAGGTVDEALAPANRNPIWSAGLTDHEAYMVGIRPPALKGATFELVVETDDDDERIPIPTFRVPGLDADVWFVVLTDPDARTSWQAVTIVVTATDGSTSSWNLAGRELKGLTVELGDR
jgi:hypothetical protein